MSPSTVKKIPYVDLAQSYKKIKKELLPKWEKALNTGIFLAGPNIKRFEKALASYYNIRYTQTVASGTDALLLSLLACRITEADEVITPSFTFVSSAISILRLGATPVFVDIDPQTYCIDPDQIEAKITKNTRAIMPVHLFGQSCKMDKIEKLARKYNLKLIEDACQAIGAEFHSKKVGTFGDLSAISFYPTKNLGSFSDGGAIITNNKSLFQMAKNLANYGFTEKYISDELGYNSRIDELQAVWLSLQLKRLEIVIKNRRRLAKTYIQNLGHLPIQLPYIQDWQSHTFNVFAIKTKKRDALKKYLEQNGITTIVHYPLPIHRQPAFKNFRNVSLPHSENASKEVLSLPIYPELSQRQQSYICESISKFFKNDK